MGNKKGGPTKGQSKKMKNEHTSVSKKKESKNAEVSKKNKVDVPKRDEKKGKFVTIVSKPIKAPRKVKDNNHSPKKGPSHNQARSLSLSKKQNAKSQEKKKGDEKNEKPKNVEAEKPQSNGSCFLCFCCCCGDNADLQTELLLEEEKRKEEEEAALKKKLELEAKKKEEEEARRKKEEEDARKRREQEELEARKRIEEEETKMSDFNEKIEDETIVEENNVEEVPKKAVLKKIGIKSKQPPKKAKINFIGAAAAPPPPATSACVGDPPKTKPTSVKLGEGVYLIYDSKVNNGQLKICYSKTAINKNGVLAYIHSTTIPPFYFEKNKGENVIASNVSQAMQSNFINDRKPYYEGWVEFIRKTIQFNGVLYLLPATEVEPPPKMEIVFLNSKEKKIYHTAIEKPIDFQGDYLFVIHRGLDVFKKEINATDILSYIGCYGAYAEL